jgi:hypothetical protein
MSNDPSAGQPRHNGAYARRPAHHPDPSVAAALPGFQNVRFPSGVTRSIGPSSAKDLVDGLWLAKPNDGACVSWFASPTSRAGTITAVNYTNTGGFTVVFSTGNTNSQSREYLTAAEGEALRVSVFDQFHMAQDIDEDDFDDDEDG